MFRVFIETEKANAYLTANLHAEVDRQLKDIKTVIEERGNLLRFVSHDMRKPLQFSASAKLDLKLGVPLVFKGGRATQFSKQRSALFWRCEMSERICHARTVTDEAVALTAEKSSVKRKRNGDEG